MDDRRNQGGQRFVLLRHELPESAERGSHWDLMLENRGVLLTWELPQLPPGPLPATFEQLGIRLLPSHRIEYLEYEGPVSDDRGTVRRVDCGAYQLTNTSAGAIKVNAIGSRFHIELLVLKAIFQQIDEPTSKVAEVIQFLDLSKVSRDGAYG